MALTKLTEDKLTAQFPDMVNTPTKSTPNTPSFPFIKLMSTTQNLPDYNSAHKCSLAQGFKSEFPSHIIQRHPETGAPISNSSGSYYSLMHQTSPINHNNHNLQNDASKLSFSEFVKPCSANLKTSDQNGHSL